MTARAGTTTDVYTEAGDRRGVWTRGEGPQELVLSDGSRLRLSDPERGQVRWRLTDGGDGGERQVTYAEAVELAGAGYSDSGRVRTRAEAGWLRAVADWCGTEARHLEREAEGAPSAT